MVRVQRATVEVWMYSGGLLSTQQAGVALGYHLVRLQASFVLSNLSSASKLSLNCSLRLRIRSCMIYIIHNS